MAEFTKNRVNVVDDDGFNKLGEIVAVVGLRVRVDPMAPTTERYVVATVDNGLVTFDTTNSGSDRFPTGYNAYMLYAKTEDLTNSSLVLSTHGFALPGNRTPTTVTA